MNNVIELPTSHEPEPEPTSRPRRPPPPAIPAGRWYVVETVLSEVGLAGVTWRELAAKTGWHHGQATGTLSTMHKAGRIARLETVRERCKVYVAYGYVAGRPTERQGQTATTALLDEMYVLLRITMLPEPEQTSVSTRAQWLVRVNEALARYEAHHG